MAVNVKDAPYNAKGDAQVVFNVSTTSGGHDVNMPASPGPGDPDPVFAPGDVGKTIWINDPLDGSTPLARTTIATYVSPTHVTSTGAMSATRSGCTLVWGTDDTAAFEAAFAAAIAGMSRRFITLGPQRITAPWGNYIVASKWYKNLGTVAENSGPDFVGESVNATMLFIAPDLAIPGGTSPAFFQNIGFGANVGGFMLNASGKMFALGSGQALFQMAETHGARLFDVYMTGAGAAAGGSIFLDVTDDNQINMENVVVQGGTIAGSNMIAMQILGTTSGVATNCLASNFPNNLLVNGNGSDGRSPIGAPFVWVGRGVDEGGTSARLVNGAQITFRDAFLYSALVPGFTPALDVAAGCRAVLDGCNLGRFNDNGPGSAIRNFGEVRLANSTLRSNEDTTYAIENHGLIVDLGGNDWRKYSDNANYVARFPGQVVTGGQPVRR